MEQQVRVVAVEADGFHQLVVVEDPAEVGVARIVLPELLEGWEL